MAEFRGAVGYYGFSGSMTLPLAGLGVESGDSVLLVWRTREPLEMAAPEGWEFIAEDLEFWRGGTEPFRYATVLRHDAQGPMDDQTLALPSGLSIAGMALALRLEEGEELTGWNLGVRTGVALNDPVSLPEPSAAGQTLLLVDFDSYGIV